MAEQSDKTVAQPASALDAIKWLSEHAHEWWTPESLDHDYAFHPTLFWRWIDEARAHFATADSARSGFANRDVPSLDYKAVRLFFHRQQEAGVYGSPHCIHAGRERASCAERADTFLAAYTQNAKR